MELMTFGAGTQRCHSNVNHDRGDVPLVQDMQTIGASMAEICAAGEWRSRVSYQSAFEASLASCLPQAVATYIDLARLERDLALEAAMHSDEEDCDWTEKIGDNQDCPIA